MGQFSFETNIVNIMEKLRFGTLLSLLILGVSSSSADTNYTTRYPSCNPNSTMPKLEGIIKSSVQDVLSESMQDILSEFFNEEFLNSLKQNSESDLTQNHTERNHTANLFAGCPIGWFRILDSCLWVPPKEAKLSHDEAYMFCKRKIPGGKLFEPMSKVHNDYAKDLVDAFDGEIFQGYIWLGINDHMEEGQYVYSKSDEPIIFENWVSGQPDGGTNQNCIAQDTGNTRTWRDIECRSAQRFICEKYLN